MYLDADLGWVCRACGRSEVTRKATPEDAKDAKICLRAYLGLDLYATGESVRRRMVK